ncbi:MAG: efflux transporter outer membrane subunit, partial [Sphingomonadales bacterium]|nr:efflux transporter outer membrane subunit [Sphingomonadales bacterium]
TLRGLDRQAAVLKSAVSDFTAADAVTRHRFADGIANGIDVGRSGSLLADSQAQLADIRNNRALVEHAIAALVGLPAASLRIAPAVVTLQMPAVPLGLPSTLLERRPDVAAAERRVFAANRTVGVERAAFFPSLDLGGAGGYQSTALGTLLTAPSLFWSVGPSLALGLFEGGRRHARVAEARAAWTEAADHYRETALGAFQQVEDGLSQLRDLGIESDDEDRAASEASAAAHASFTRYVKGVSDYLDVLTAQTTEVTEQQRAVQVHTARLLAGVDLVQALGGDWNPADNRLAAPATPPPAAP